MLMGLPEGFELPIPLSTTGLAFGGLRFRRQVSLGVRAGRVAPQFYPAAHHQMDNRALSVQLHLPCTYGKRLENGGVVSD